MAQRFSASARTPAPSGPDAPAPAPAERLRAAAYLDLWEAQIAEVAAGFAPEAPRERDPRRKDA